MVGRRRILSEFSKQEAASKSKSLNAPPVVAPPFVSRLRGKEVIGFNIFKSMVNVRAPPPAPLAKRRVHPRPAPHMTQAMAQSHKVRAENQVSGVDTGKGASARMMQLSKRQVVT